MNVEIGAEAAQFPGKEYIYANFVEVYLSSCSNPNISHILKYGDISKGMTKTLKIPRANNPFRLLIVKSDL
jgi:hypothetical protein